MKYYRIRSDSNTFNTYLNNAYCLKLLDEFGFHIEANSKDLLFPLETTEKFINKKYKLFTEAIKKLAKNIN